MVDMPTSVLSWTWETMAPWTSITIIWPEVVPKYTFKKSSICYELVAFVDVRVSPLDHFIFDSLFWKVLK